MIPLPAPFSLALKTKIPSIGPQPFGKKITAPAQQRRLAESCIQQGQLALQQGNVKSGLTWFRKAQILAPDEPRYAAMIEKTESQMALANTWNAIRHDLQFGKTQEAWEAMSRQSEQNPEFFLFSAYEFAQLLEMQGQIASAVSILRTYCRVRPAESRARILLEKTIQKFTQATRRQ